MTIDIQLSASELAEDPRNDDFWPIIRDGLSQHTEISLEVEIAARKIAAILPEDNTDSNDTSSFNYLCFQVAEHIPWDDSKNMQNLVQLMYLVYNNPRYMHSPTRTDKSGKVYPRYRYERLSMDFTDVFNSHTQRRGPGDFERCVRVHTFIAYLCLRGDMIQPVTSIGWVLIGVFEKDRRKEDDAASTQEVLVMAAARYIVIVGGMVLERLINAPREDISAWCAGPYLPKGIDPGSVARWHFWRDSFRSIHVKKGRLSEWQSYRSEVVDTAGRAADEMDRIEQEVGMSTRIEPARETSRDHSVAKSAVFSRIKEKMGV